MKPKLITTKCINATRITWRVALILVLLSALTVGWLPAQSVQAQQEGWSIETVDLPAPTWSTSLALDSKGFPHISYYFRVDAYYLGLRYAHKTESGWLINDVALESNPAHPRLSYVSSLAIDSRDRPHIIYSDEPYPADTRLNCLKYAYFTGSNWDIQYVMVNNVKLGVGGLFSLALDSNDYPHITYSGTDGKLWYIYKDGSGWHTSRITDEHNLLNIHSSLALDNSGTPHVVYSGRWNQPGSAGCNQCLNYARWNGSTWDLKTVDATLNSGSQSSLALDSRGFPHLIYYNGNGAIKYATNKGSGWVTYDVDPTPTTNAGGIDPSIAIDSSGTPHVSYGRGVQKELWYGYFDGSNWMKEYVAQSAQYPLASLLFSSIKVDANGVPHISYSDAGGSKPLMYAVKSTVTDNTPPVIAPSVDGTLGNEIWYISDVSVAWNVSDPESTITSQSGCDPVNVTSDTAGVTFTCVATSAGGPTSQSVTIKRDATIPTITASRNPAANANGWNNSDVTLHFTCEDSLSGMAACSPDQTLITEGQNLPTAGTATDMAGNSATITVENIKIDKTGPMSTVSVEPAASPYGWNNSDVTVSWNWTDSTAGIDDMNCIASAIAKDEGIAPLAATCQDLAGNQSEAVYTVQIDKTAPAISGSRTPAPNAKGWNNTNVTVSFACADSLSDIATDTVAGATVSTEGQDQQLLSTGDCIDKAGNHAVAATIGNINIDKTPPTLNPVVSPNPVLRNGVATVTSGAADTLSGFANDICGAVDTSTVGDKHVTCSATDNAGNSASASASYQVIDQVLYNWMGFFRPIDNDRVNAVNAGQSIPVKFSVGGDHGLNIFTSGYPASQRYGCSDGNNGPLEPAVTVDNRGLQYDPATGIYTYVWKTNKDWAGSCRRLIVRLNDGVDHIALFEFKNKGKEGEVTIMQQVFLPLITVTQ